MWVAWVGLGEVALRSGRDPTQGASIPYARRNHAGPQHFCLYRGVLRVGAGNRARPPSSGGSAFSSGTTLASLGVRKSFVLRDERDIKTQFATDFGRCAIRDLGASEWCDGEPPRRASGYSCRVCVTVAWVPAVVVSVNAAQAKSVSRRPFTETGRSWER